MNVLWVFAHPEPCSLSGSLRDDGVARLRADGHQVRQSDLYQMGWKATVDRGDFADDPPAGRLSVAAASKRAFETGRLRSDIRDEQDKLSWADTVVFQFPLWWYGMPAILKGWFDRVFVKGYAYGVTDPGDRSRTLRYGEGALQGKRALVVVSAGSPEAPMGPRGINGQLDQVLFPLLHGTLWYTGMSVLEPVAVHGADRVSDEQYRAAAAMLGERLAGIEHATPIGYRSQNGGDYDHDLVLRPELAGGRSGLGVHSAG